MTTQTIVLNMKPGGVLPVIHASQFDFQTDALIFQLYSGDSTFTVPDGAGVLLDGKKPDGNGFSYSASSVSGYTVYCNVTQQMTAVAGDVLCELRVYTGSQEVGTCNFILRVEESPLDDSMLSDTDIPLIEQAVAIAGELAEQMVVVQNAVTTTTTAANTASSAATTAQNAANAVAAQYNSLETLKSETTAAKEAAQDAADDISNITATATTLAAGSSATASYNASTQVLTLGIPRGATGESGVFTEVSGLFAMSVDDDGNLYAYANDALSADNFSYDSETGNLYYIISEE